MIKKTFIWFVLLGALCILIVLPIINYKVDKYRVLHNDYTHSYPHIEPNKAYLKMIYLLDHKNKYDTLIMGSSRGGYVDASKISKSAYNMKHNFALAAMHLNDLKILLKHQMKIKNVWIGVNDYIIWKDPLSHDDSFQRRRYRDEKIEKLKDKFWFLFKSLDRTDFDILFGKIKLENFTYITEPNKHNAREREENILAKPKLWKKRMSSIAPTLLHYDDTTYRIDEAVEDLNKIKTLCEKHNIKLRVFFYPSFYRTFLKYNQRKIAEFKRKLALTMPFYDFYHLDDISMNELKWNDGSHFVPSVGDHIISSIYENKYLINSNNVEHDITLDKESFYAIMNKSLNYIYDINPHRDISKLKKIFAMKEKEQYRINEHFEINDKKMKVWGYDPILLLNKMNPRSENVLLRCKIKSHKKTFFQIFYKIDKDNEYSGSRSFIYKLHKGNNEFTILIPSEYIRHGLRLDIVDIKGKYLLEYLEIYDFKKL